MIEAMKDTNFNLRLEAAHLYRCLFKRDLPDLLALHYIDAHESLSDEWKVTGDQAHTLQLIVENGLSATAVEPWLRRRGSHHIVSAKLLLLVHLDECGHRDAGILRNTRLGRFGLLLSVIRGGISLFYGLYLKKRYGLV